MDIAIRRYRASDAEAFHAAVLESTGHISAWLPWCTPDYSIEDATEWAASAARTWEEGSDYRFVIEDRDTLQFLGSVGINQVVHQHRIGNLGYWVRKSAINNDVCTRAARLAVRTAFEQLGFQRIEIHVHTENAASNRVAAKLGGLYEGIVRNKLWFKGASVPAKCYSIIPGDYGIAGP